METTAPPRTPRRPSRPVPAQTLWLALGLLAAALLTAGALVATGF
jgi:hypothetical protein